MRHLPESSYLLPAGNYRPLSGEQTQVSFDQIPEIAVVTPLYNPGPGWKDTFTQHAGTLEAAIAGNARLKFIIVNDGSTGSVLHRELMELTQKMDNVSCVTYEKNEGKGYALRKGLSASNCSYTVVTDIDFPYDSDNITTIIAFLLRGYEVVTGVRNKTYFDQLPVKRKIISKTFISCNRLLFSLPVHDTQAGIKGFGPKGKAVFLETKINRFLADTEFMIRAKKQQLSFKSVSLQLRPGVIFSDFGTSTIFAECRNFLRLIRLQYKRNRSARL